MRDEHDDTALVDIAGLHALAASEHPEFPASV